MGLIVALIVLFLAEKGIMWWMHSGKSSDQKIKDEWNKLV